MARIKLVGETAVYHCISRVVGGQMLLDSLCKEKLVELLGRLSAFCGVEVLTYCMMSNHFHVLVRVPPPPELSDEALLEKLSVFYGERGVWTVLARESLKDRGRIDADIRESVMSRMGDVSAFMKEFKQRFSRWYNKQTGRFGTLWAERFTSLLVENSPVILRAVAAYIDLNPERAHLVKDPKDYRFCGYTAALVGDSTIRKGLMSFLEPTDWTQAAAEYRLLLFVTAGSANGSDKQVLDPEVIRAELARGGELGLGQVLRLRIRHFTDGVFLGSKEFVNEMFVRYRDRFGPKRKDGARPIRGVPLPGISVLRDLRVNSIG
jgi:REP element-mobilizing transposase RayT